jgi:uncharacterized protein (TIGR00369 family)
MTAARQRVVTWHDPDATARAGRALAGLDYLNAIRTGTLPAPPIAVLMGFELETVEPGRAVMVLTPGEHLYNPQGTVHGGVAATLLDSVMGCAVHSTLPVGRGFTTIEIKVNYLKPVIATTGPLRAEGKVVQVGRQIAMAEGRLTDGAGRLYAAGTTSCLVFDVPPPDRS